VLHRALAGETIESEGGSRSRIVSSLRTAWRSFADLPLRS